MKVTVYAARKTFNGRMVSRTFPNVESVTKGWYFTESEAKAVYEEYVKLKNEEYVKLKPKALDILNQVENELNDEINRIQNKYNCCIWSDGHANDDSGLQTYVTISTTINGEYDQHTYYRKVYI